ncbi:MAG: ATP-grasp domain-containing protein [Bacteriovoracia bacterium]
MKIAFTHNLKVTDAEEEAEFDTKETVAAITDALTQLGHQVEPVEVSGPVSRTIARLEALHPDLIFNTAEGKTGRYREAFYPGIFDQLGIPYTGSDAYVCTLTLDKHMTKLMVAGQGIPVPRSQFFVTMAGAEKIDLRFPVILKPNFEGSSKGITQDSIAETPAAFQEKLQRALTQYPIGILVEEYIVGRDIAVPFIEGAAAASGGVLAPIEYVFDTAAVGPRKYQIYDYELKNSLSDHVHLKVPAEVNSDVGARLQKMSQVIFKTLGVHDAARIDFRVTPNGEIYFIEINALPSLEPGAGIYQAAKLAGLSETKDVLGAIIANACLRQKVRLTTRSKNKRHLRVGFTFNQKRVPSGDYEVNDTEAEYDSPSTLGKIREAIRSHGHEVVDLEATPELPNLLSATNVDVVFNIAEGLKGRNRESQIPAMLELLDIPYTGSDPTTLSITLDKSLAKKVVRNEGILTPNFFLMTTGREKLPKELRFPVIVKPVAEGSSKGVVKKSVAHNEAELRAIANTMIRIYHQSALVEEFLTGREFTVALLGENRPRVLPPMEIIFAKKDEAFPVYTYQHKLDRNDEIQYQAPAQIDEKLRKQLESVAKRSFIALGCRDVARIDLRLDAEGRVNFVECNPLPGLTPGWSDLCMIAESAGMDYRTLIGEILAPAVRRAREKDRHQALVQAQAMASTQSSESGRNELLNPA